MNITPELICEIARKSRLQLTEQEILQYAKDVKDILTAFETLQKVPTQGVKPSFQPITVQNIIREDTPQESITQEQSLRNSVHLNKLVKGPRLQ